MKNNKRIGQYHKSPTVAGEAYRAYLPPKLPPDPPLAMSVLTPLLDQANVALGRLDGISIVLPEPDLFLYMYIRKEAIFSSQIEGTQSSLSDLLLAESEQAPGVPVNDDITEVCCYIAAMNYGIERLKQLPLSLRLIREMHSKLMRSARGAHKQPGEFRTSQNWIGGSRPGNARFVPPPPEELMACLDHFEKFLHDDSLKLPTLIKAALAHVQFETIHPFLDGNGRLGRLLIAFILYVDGILKKPLLYLSLYLKVNRQAYYDHLQSVRETGDWESWIEFFLIGVIETANQATEAIDQIVKLFRVDQQRIEKSNQSTKAAATLHRYLQRQPIVTTTTMCNKIGLSRPTVVRSLAVLENLHIVEEITGKQRHKVFVYRHYLDILNRSE